MLSYSVAIRTLGTSGDKLKKTLEGIHAQSVKPERICIYIAEGYSRPDFTVGQEEYFWVRKGMMYQRILPYKEIDSDCIFTLDDDIFIPEDCAEIMLSEIEQAQFDCIGGDCFKNHEMSFWAKLYNIIVNFACPIISKKWGVKIGRSGASYYNLSPCKKVYLAQSVSGGCAMWRKRSFLYLSLEDELWLEKQSYTYGEDFIVFNKAYKNGLKLGILFNPHIMNLDGASSSANYRKNSDRFFVRAKCIFLLWWRSCYSLRQLTGYQRLYTAVCFGGRYMLNMIGVSGAALFYRDKNILINHIRGTIEGWKITHSSDFKSLPDYIK